MKKEIKMTEQQFIAKFKKHGFELYEVKSLTKKLDAFYKMQKIAKDADKD